MGTEAQYARRIAKVFRPFIPDSILRYRQQLMLGRHAKSLGLEIITHDLFYDLRRADTILRIRKDHRVYLQHMLENFDYYVDSVVPLHADGMTIVDMSGPRYHRLKGFGDIPFLFPSHVEPFGTTAEYLDFAQLKHGQIVIDVGSYSAVTSIIFAQLVGPGGHVYAFEADERNYECAKVNVEMAARTMGLKNITLINQAIWSHNNGVLFSGEAAMGSSAVSVTGGHRGLQRVIPSIRLQDFFAEHGLNSVDFVKVDIEGCELEMLQCSAGFLRKAAARLIVEPHFVAGELSTERCCHLLEAAGYRVRVRGKVGESEPLIEATP